MTANYLTLTQARADFLQWVADPAGTFFADGGNYARLDLLLNTTYRELVAIVDREHRAFNVAPVPIAVTVVAGSREYVLGGATEETLRAPVDVVNIDDPTRPAPVPIIGFEQRNDPYRQRLVEGGYCVSDRGAYFYRTATGQWMIGAQDPQPVAAAWQVWYTPPIGWVGDASGRFRFLPQDSEYLVPLGAALKGKVIENRELQASAQQMYMQGLLDMRAYLRLLRGSNVVRSF